MAGSLERNIRYPLLWVLALSILSVGAKNFEPGMGIDAQLYAQMARTMARTGEWFYLECAAPEYHPFTDHPHLGLWLIALVFKVFPPADWSARLVGHLFYVAFLWGFFLGLRRATDEKIATLAVLLLWIWFRFSNFFSNAYLDPGALFFGMAALFVFDRALVEGRRSFALLAGLFLGLSTLIKGMTVLGFLPALAFLWFFSLGKRRWKNAFTCAVLLIAAIAMVLAVYQTALSFSRVPDFSARYFARQWENRFAVSWDWKGLWSAEFWDSVWEHSYKLAPLALVSLRPKYWNRWTAVAFIWFGTFFLMYAPTARVGQQYSLAWLPPLAFLISQPSASLIFFPVRKLAWATGVFSVVAVLVIQYIPFHTHGTGYTHPAMDDIRRYEKEHPLESVWMDMGNQNFDYFAADSFYWYLDIPTHAVLNGSPVPKAAINQVYFVLNGGAVRDLALVQNGWCRLYLYPPISSLWMACAGLPNHFR